MTKRHPLAFVIADSDAVRTLSNKVEAWGQHQQRREAAQGIPRGGVRVRRADVKER